MLVYAIGDIHGCLGLLTDLLGQIDLHAAGADRRLVFLGDYIDRGADSAGVVATLRRLQAGAPERVICLKGNHEDIMLRAAADPDDQDPWLRNGGNATLQSFGRRSVSDVPADTLAWLAACPVEAEDQHRIFVHAGLRPGRSRAEQTDHDRLWIRDEFLNGHHDFGKLVVHGHTPQRSGRPDLQPHRLNIDTAAIYGGCLTAAVFTMAAASPISFLRAPSV